MAFAIQSIQKRLPKIIGPACIGGEVELTLRDFPGADARSDVLGCHGMVVLTVRAAIGPPSVRAVSRTTPRGALRGLSTVAGWRATSSATGV
jgi:hypothetical protein